MHKIDLMDHINAVSEIYNSTDWGTDIGTINFNLVEIDVVRDYSGIYASLYPSFVSSSCTNVLNRNCEVDNTDLLSKFKNFLDSWKDLNTFDNGQLFSRLNFEGSTIGTAWVGTICFGAGYSSGVNEISGNFAGDATYFDTNVRLVTHETGHNFDASHDDSSNGCTGSSAGVMSSPSSSSSFSSCTITSVQNFFVDESGLTCLGSGNREDATLPDVFVFDFNITLSPTSAPTASPIIDPSLCSGFSCIKIFDLDDFIYSTVTIDFNGDYVSEDCFGGNILYKMTSTDYYEDRYMYFSESFNMWFLGFEANDNGVCNAYCTQTDVSNCGGYWRVYQNGWIQDTDSISEQCSSGGSRRRRRMGGAKGGLLDYSLSDDCSDVYEYEYNEFVCIDIGYNGSLTRHLWNIYYSNIEESLDVINDTSEFDIFDTINTMMFIFDGCKNDIPFYYYKYDLEITTSNNDDYVIYYLHFDDNRWYISESILIDSVGVAYCQEFDLTNCLAGNWYVLETMDYDMAYYQVDNDVSYEINCELNESNDVFEDDFCDDSDACAVWMIELNIEYETTLSSTNYNNAPALSALCTDGVFDSICVESGLNAVFEVENTYYELEITCEYDTGLHVILSVEFENSDAYYTTYSSFLTQYEAIIDTCQDYDKLSVEMISSELQVCEKCDAFINTHSDENDMNININAGSKRFGFSIDLNRFVAVIVLFVLYF